MMGDWDNDPGPIRSLEEAVRDEAKRIYTECEDIEDAMSYLDEAISDIVAENTDRDDMEVREMLVNALKEKFRC